MKQTIRFFTALICQLEGRAQARHEELVASIVFTGGGMSADKAMEHARKSTQLIAEQFPIEHLAKQYLDE